MLKLHIANKNYSSWSLRPWVLMKEQEIEFEEELHPFASTSNGQEFSKFSPNAMVPCLNDSETVVWDSLSICEYLAESHPAIWPASKQARAWARSAAAEMHSGFFNLRNTCAMNCGVRVNLHEISAGLKKDLQRLDELWQEGLSRFGGPFLAGDRFTVVDAFFAPVAFRVQSYGLEMASQSHEYLQQILNLNSMKDWYQSALKEPWKEAGHEEEVLAVGTITEDFREMNS